MLSKSDLNGTITPGSGKIWNIQEKGNGLYYGTNVGKYYYQQSPLEKGTLNLLQNNKKNTSRNFLTLDNVYVSAYQTGDANKVIMGQQTVDSTYHTGIGYYSVTQYRYTYYNKDFTYSTYNDATQTGIHLLDPNAIYYRPTINFLETG